MRNLTIGAAALLVIGCSSVSVEDVPLQIRNSCPIGEPIEITMGDNMCWVVAGHWLDTFTAQRSISLAGLDPIAAGSVWMQSAVEANTGIGLLINPEFDEHIALRVLAGGVLAMNPSAVQIGGLKRGRQWTESPSSAEPAMKWIGYDDHPEFRDQTGWRLYYVGVDNKKLRLTADDLGPGGESLGRIEYTHDLGVGNLFVFRGMSIRVDDVLSDGRLRFTVVKTGRI